jgi:hypothetical protein
VEEPDVRHGLDDRLAVEGEDEPQGGVRGRVLRAEVQGVQELLVRTRFVGYRQRVYGNLVTVFSGRRPVLVAAGFSPRQPQRGLKPAATRQHTITPPEET